MLAIATALFLLLNGKTVVGARDGMDRSFHIVHLCAKQRCFKVTFSKFYRRSFQQTCLCRFAMLAAKKV
jgi:hypothetical protein